MIMNDSWKKWLGYVGVMLFIIHCTLFTVSCSEESVEEDEFANWQERNDAAVKEWAANNAYTKILTYTKTEGVTPSLQNSDYIYVEKLETGSGTESPIFTDTVRVAYRGRYIPMKSYPEGYVFDQSYTNDFSWQTAGVADFTCDALVDGFTTALMNMHVGDYWRVRIPYQLGYGTSSTNSITGYSDLVFDIALYDFWHPGEHRSSFKSR